MFIMEQLNTSISKTLYDQLADQIRYDIYEGKFKQGEKIPSEFELSDMYKVSRSTVRKAISILVQESLLEKAHGKGTFVSSATTRQNNSSFLSFTDNVRLMGQTLTTKTILVSHEMPTKGQQQFFNLSGNESLLKIERLRYVDNIAICMETTWFTTAFDSLQTKNLNGSLYAILQNEYNIRPLTGSKTIELCYASSEEAELLDVPRGSALMLIEDMVYDSTGTPLHISKQVVRGDKFKYALK